jgi:hypothetical protein
VRIAIEEHFRSKTVVEPLFEDLEDDQVFVETTPEWIPENLFAGGDAKEIASEARICEVDFGRFDDSFPDVFKIWRELENNVRRFEDTHPALDCYGRNSKVIAEGGVIDNLPDPASQERQKVLKPTEVLDVHEGSDVTLDVGLDVTVEEAIGFEILFVNPRKRSTHDEMERVPLSAVVLELPQ